MHRSKRRRGEHRKALGHVEIGGAIRPLLGQVVHEGYVPLPRVLSTVIVQNVSTVPWVAFKLSRVRQTYGEYLSEIRLFCQSVGCGSTALFAREAIHATALTLSQCNFNADQHRSDSLTSWLRFSRNATKSVLLRGTGAFRFDTISMPGTNVKDIHQYGRSVSV